jgi:hypothetical protein
VPVLPNTILVFFTHFSHKYFLFFTNLWKLFLPKVYKSVPAKSHLVFFSNCTPF